MGDSVVGVGRRSLGVRIQRDPQGAKAALGVQITWPGDLPLSHRYELRGAVIKQSEQARERRTSRPMAACRAPDEAAHPRRPRAVPPALPPSASPLGQHPTCRRVPPRGAQATSRGPLPSFSAGRAPESFEQATRRVGSLRPGTLQVVAVPGVALMEGSRPRRGPYWRLRVKNDSSLSHGMRSTRS